MSEESPQEILEGADLCLCCLEPVRPGACRCVKCGAPQDFIACTMPFLRVLAEGFVYHRAIQQPRSWLSVAGIWLIFGQLTMGGIAMLHSWGSVFFDGSIAEICYLVLPGAAFALVGISGIILCTSNYFAFRRSLGS